MSKTAYNLELKGLVGGADFDRKAVDNMLAKNQGKQVNAATKNLQSYGLRNVMDFDPRD